MIAILLLLLSCQGQTHDSNILATKNENSKEYRMVFCRQKR